MVPNKIEHLRNHLFATIEGLLDEDNPMDVQRAKAVAEVGKVLVESAKVEVDFLREINRGVDVNQASKFWVDGQKKLE